MPEAKGKSKSSPRAHLLKGPPSTQHVVEQLRKKFQENLTISRSIQQCRNRNLHGTSGSRVQTRFENTIPVEKELNREKMTSFLVEVEEELNEKTLQEEADAYDETITDQEIDAILKNYLCFICNMPIESLANTSFPMCADCNDLYVSKDNL